MKAMWNNTLDQAARLRDEDQPFVIATVVAYKSPQSAKPGSKAIITLTARSTAGSAAGAFNRSSFAKHRKRFKRVSPGS